MDPKLTEGQCAMRRIPCLCEECTKQLDKDWIPQVPAADQPRYGKVERCKYSNILGSYNDWIIMPFKHGVDNSEEDMDDIHQMILNSIAGQMAATIEKNSFGVVNTDDQRTDGFYVIKFLSKAYTLQEDITVNDELLKSGTLVCDAEYQSQAQPGSLWYVRSSNETQPIKLQVSKILITDLSVDIIDGVSQLDRSMRSMTQEEVSARKPFKLSSYDYDRIIDEISRREEIDYEIGSDDEIETDEI
jgi:hypothetical protein